MNYIIDSKRASVIWNCRKNAGEPTLRSLKVTYMPIILNTYFSSDLEYLVLQLPIGDTNHIGKSFANLALL